MAKKPNRLTVETLKHDKATRKNIPTAEYQPVMKKDEQNPVRVTLERGGGDTFAMCNSSVAAVFDPWKHTLYPAFEVVSFGNFSDFNSVNPVPELIWRACEGFQLKTAFACGLTNDGEDYGAEFMWLTSGSDLQHLIK
jgi:hypothetical protein